MKDLLKKLELEKKDNDNKKLSKKHKAIDDKKIRKELKKIQQEITGNDSFDEPEKVVFIKKNYLDNFDLQDFFKPNNNIRNGVTVSAKIENSIYKKLDHSLYLFNVLNRDNKQNRKIYIQDLINNILHEWNNKTILEIKKMQNEVFN